MKKPLASTEFSRTSPAVSKIGSETRNRMASAVAAAIISRSAPPTSQGSSLTPSGRTSGPPSFVERDRADPVDEPGFPEFLGPGSQSVTVPVEKGRLGESRGDVLWHG